MAQALDLYRGPFLDGFTLPDCPEFEAWLDLERSAWVRRCDDALAGLVEAHTAARNYAAAITAARHALSRDELAEEMHRRLIALYAAAGNRTAALRQFEQCAVVLERELGVAPLPETRAVYEAVRDGTSLLPPVAPAPAAAPARATGVQDRPPSAGGIPIPPTSLIGRAAMLAELTAARAALLAGDLAEAQRRFAEARASAVALRDRFLEAEASNNLGEVARLAGDDQAAEMHYTASLRLCLQLGSQVEAQRRIHSLGYLALHRCARASPRAWLAFAPSARRAAGSRRWLG
jgi:tetratricopeptide (TPR) repeat protein